MTKIQILVANAGIVGIVFLIIWLIHAGIVYDPIDLIFGVVVLAPPLWWLLLTILDCLQTGKYDDPDLFEKTTFLTWAEYFRFGAFIAALVVALIYFRPVLYRWPEPYIVVALWGFAWLYTGTCPKRKNA